MATRELLDSDTIVNLNGTMVRAGNLKAGSYIEHAGFCWRVLATYTIANKALIEREY